MSDILSQEEVDTLLRGVQSGEIDTEAARGEVVSAARPYDFASQERIIRGKMVGLETSFDRFAGLFSTSLSSLISQPADVQVSGMEVMKFGECMKRVNSPASMSIVKINPLKGFALVVMEAPLAFGLVEFFFGGSSGEPVNPEERSFTAIEQRIIGKVVAAALVDMAAAWRGIAEIHPEQIGFEANPQLVAIAGQREPVIRVEISVEIEDFRGKLYFCIPFAMVEPLWERLVSPVQCGEFEIDRRWTACVREALRETKVEVSVELGRVLLTCRELLDLGQGSVVGLSRPTSAELPIRIEGLPKLFGQPGCRKGNQAIQVTRVCEKGEVDE